LRHGDFGGQAALQSAVCAVVDDVDCRLWVACLGAELFEAECLEDLVYVGVVSLEGEWGVVVGVGGVVHFAGASVELLAGFAGV
jgi:hypothetical protein